MFCYLHAYIALTLYEYLLTLSNEFILFWEFKSISASSFLYLLLRVILLAIASTTIAGNYVPHSTDTVSTFSVTCLYILMNASQLTG